MIEIIGIFLLIKMKNYHKNIEKIINKSFLPGSFALDLGCGVGDLTLPMAQNGLNVNAVDSNVSRINQIRDKKGNLSINVFPEDIAKFPIEKNKYSVIIARNVFPFILDKKIIKKIITSISDGLVDGGEFGFTLFGPKDGWGKRKDMTFYEYNEIFETLKEVGLELVESFEDMGEGLTVAGDTKFWHIHTYICKKIKLS